MNIRIECPLCGFHKDVPDHFGGKEVKCPHCDTKFSAPFPQVTVLETPSPGRPKSKAKGGSGVRPKPRRQRKWAVVVAGVVLAVAAGGTVAYLVSLKGSAEVAEASSPSVGPSDDKAAEQARLAADKKAAEDKAERDRATALAKKEKEERAEKERRQKEADKRAAEEQKERERKEQQAREEKERKERDDKKRKEREEKERQEREAWEAKRNPKQSATPEEVDTSPDKYFGKRLYFDNVRLKAEAIKKAKDMDLYTLGVTSKSGTYYSSVVLGSIFFSADPQLIADVQKEWELVEMFPRVRLYCEIRPYEKKPGAKPVPQAHIFKLQIYNSQGTLVKTWEEADPDAPPAKDNAKPK